MPRTSPHKPGSPAAEAAWYDSPEGRRQTQRELELALKRGAVLRSQGAPIPPAAAEVLAELVEKAKPNATRPVSIRLPLAGIEQARKIGAKQGIGYQTILKRAIHAGLKKVS